LHNFFVNSHQFKRFRDERQLSSRFKLSVQNVHQLQQHTIVIAFEMTGLNSYDNELLWQIILYRGNVGRFWRVFLIASHAFTNVTSHTMD